MKSLVTLLTTLIQELGEYCAVDTSKDIKTILTRLNGEGEWFLAITLPTLAKGLERGLDTGVCNPDLFPNFGCRQKTPVLLGSFFDLIFDRTSGTVLPEPSIEAIRSIRQISLFGKKTELDCSPAVIAEAFSGFVKCDKEVAEWEASVTIDALMEFHKMSSLLFSEVFLKVNREVALWKINPRHGPGATADRLVGNHKFEMPEYTERLEAVFPFWRFATTRGYRQETYDRVPLLEPGHERPVKVVHVPKTLDAPRIIAEEPTCMQYVQQGLLRSFRDAIDGSYLQSLMGVEHQEPNQLMAQKGSRDGTLATLDLSEASDRVSNLLVITMMANFPHLNDAVQACRSLRADVPGHGILNLAKFAPMGSALCFPVEMMVFLTVIFIGIQRAYRYRLTKRSDILKWLGSVRVYGDDIIVPVDVVDSVRSALRLYGFKVNVHKSFWTGKFRESCGKEYYDGEDVTLTRLRHLPPTSLDQTEQVISMVDFRNQAYWRGLWKTAGIVDSYISEMMPFPVVMETSTILGRQSVLGIPEYPLDRNLHRPLVTGMRVRYRRRFSPIDDDAALLKSLRYGLNSSYPEEVAEQWTPRGTFSQTPTEADHLIYSGRPTASALHRRRGFAD